MVCATCFSWQVLHLELVSSQFFGVAQSLMKLYHGVNEIETRGGYDGALIACFHE